MRKYKNKGLKIIAILFFILIQTGISKSQSIESLPSDNETVKLWVEKHFAKGKIPPFSFVYGGKNSDIFISRWQFSAVTIKSASPDMNEFVFTYYEPGSGLKEECLSDASRRSFL